MMTIDIHCHCKLSKKIHFSIPSFLKYIRMAKRSGLSSIVLTEHFNTRDFYDIYDKLSANFSYFAGCYNIYGFKVFCGMEVNVKEGGHIIVVGKLKDVLEIRALFPEMISEQDYPCYDFLMEQANIRNMIKIGAHPCRKDNNLSKLSDQALKQLDFIELNAKNFNQRNEVYNLSNKLKLPIIAGSDSHNFLQLGSVKNVLLDDCMSFADLYTCLKSNRFVMSVSPHIKLKLASAYVYKKLLKNMKIWISSHWTL